MNSEESPYCVILSLTLSRCHQVIGGHLYCAYYGDD